MFSDSGTDMKTDSLTSFCFKKLVFSQFASFTIMYFHNLFFFFFYSMIFLLNNVFSPIFLDVLVLYSFVPKKFFHLKISWKKSLHKKTFSPTFFVTNTLFTNFFFFTFFLSHQVPFFTKNTCFTLQDNFLQKKLFLYIFCSPKKLWKQTISNCDKIQEMLILKKLNLWQIKTQNVTKLKLKIWQLKKSNCDQTQIVRKLKNSSCATTQKPKLWKTQKLKLWQNSKTQNVTKL